MRSPLHPAEELFALRAEIRALRAREAELEDYFMEAAAPARCGPLHEARLEPFIERVLVPSRLPADLSSDPSLYERRITTRLTLHTRDPQALFTPNERRPRARRAHNTLDAAGDWRAVAGRRATNGPRGEDCTLIDPFDV
ncbi:MAG: hypothetical protein ACRBCL_01650 [Maritimibacter sp.]